MSWLLEETEAKLMQIAACQPVSFCLEYNLRQDEHAVTGNAGASSIPGSPFRAAGYSTAAKADVELQ